MRMLFVLTITSVLVLGGCVGFSKTSGYRGPASSAPQPQLGAPATAPDSILPDPPITEPLPEEGPLLPAPDSAIRHESIPTDAILTQLARDVTPAKIPGRSRGQSAVRWTPSAHSGQRRAINSLRIGSGGRRTLLLGSLHGNEPLAVQLIDRLAAHAAKNREQWQNGSVLFVRTPNPDGLATGRRANSRGIDLNRNFPARARLTRRSPRMGPVPGSEAETKFVMRVLYAYRPARIVHIKSTTDETGWVLHSRRAEPVVRKFPSRGELRISSLPTNAIAGSLESYAADMIGIEVITISLPANLETGEAWQRYQDVLLTAVGVRVDRGVNGRPDAWANGRKRPPGGIGSRAARAGGDGPVPTTGYYELPPPPDEG